MPGPRRFRTAWGDPDGDFAPLGSCPFAGGIDIDGRMQNQRSPRAAAAYCNKNKDPHISWKDQEENDRLGRKLDTARSVIVVRSQNAAKITYRPPNAKQRKEQARLHQINLSYLSDNIAGARSPYQQAKMVTPYIPARRAKEGQQSKPSDESNGRAHRKLENKAGAGRASCGAPTAQYDHQIAQQFYDFAAEKLKQQHFSTVEERTLWFAKLYHTNVAECGHKTVLLVIKQLSYGCDQIAILRAIESAETPAAV